MDLIDKILTEVEIPEGNELVENHTLESILEQFAPDNKTYDTWLQQLKGYELRTHTHELYMGDHTKYLDIKNEPILRKGGMLVRFDEDINNAMFRMGKYIWTVKADNAIFFQKPGKQARIMALLQTITGVSEKK